MCGRRLRSAGDTDYVRRVSLNVARVTQSGAGTITLAAALLAGVPVAGMQVARVDAFCDREGGGFFQEWSGLFVVEGEQGGPGCVLLPAVAGYGGCGGELGWDWCGVGEDAAGWAVSGFAGGGCAGWGDGGLLAGLCAGGWAWGLVGFD